MRGLDLTADAPNYVVMADNARVLPALPDRAFRLIYLDPPFNTGRPQRRQSLTTTRSATGDRVGFAGRSYETVRGTVQ